MTTRHTQSGTAVSELSIATTERFKPRDSDEWKEETEWHRVILWRNEGILPYLTKGQKVSVQGRLQTRSWEAQDGQKRYRTEVVAERINLEGSGKRGPRDEDEPGRRGNHNEDGGSRNDDGDPGMTDDDVPF